MQNYPKSQSLRHTLKEWEDLDIAAYKLGCAVGIFPPEDGSYFGFQSLKGLYWGANRFGESISGILDVLVKCDVLQYDEERMKIRWNPNFKGDWESV